METCLIEFRKDDTCMKDLDTFIELLGRKRPEFKVGIVCWSDLGVQVPINIHTKNDVVFLQHYLEVAVAGNRKVRQQPRLVVE